MKRIPFAAMIFMSVCLLGFLQFAGGQPAREGKVLKADRIELVSPDGTKTISIMATNEMVGIWLNDSKTKRSVAIYNSKDQAALGIYGNTDTPLLNGLGVDGQDGFIQLYKDGKRKELR